MASKQHAPAIHPRGHYRTGQARITEILEAAHKAFISAGYRATSLRDIARAADISHAALLRYFPSRAAILTALIERLDASSDAHWAQVTARTGTWPSMAAIARRNSEIPGWIELFTALLGEATSPSHPGHAIMRARRGAGTELARRGFSAIGFTPEETEVEIHRLGAAWEGLQILWLYFPDEIDIVAHLEGFDQRVLSHRLEPDPLGAHTREPALAPADQPVLTAAARLYAEHGYHETSMQAVANAAGLTRAALLHIAPTKQGLLDHVLEGLFGRPPSGFGAAGLGAGAGAGSGANIFHPARGPHWSTAAEIVLLCEAVVASHPAHECMAAHLRALRAEVTGRLRSEGVADPASSADWLIGLSLGTQIAWLYEPESITRGPALSLARA